MSANVETMFSVRETPWHGLGRIVMDAPASREALELAGLNWQVESRNIYSGTGAMIPGYRANVRSTDDAVLGVVSDRYRIVQNEEAFQFTDDLLGEGITYETAGSLQGVEKVLRLAGRVNFMIGITLFAILFFFGQQITSFFFKGGEALDALAIANYGITIYCFTFLMSGLNILASSYFTAIGNAKLSVVISMLRSLVFVTFGIIVYPSLFGIQSIWYNVPVAELCTLFISFMLVRRELLKEAVLKN